MIRFDLISFYLISIAPFSRVVIVYADQKESGYMEFILEKHNPIFSQHMATLHQIVGVLDTLSLELEIAKLPDHLYLLAVGKGSQKLLEAFIDSYKGEILHGIVLSSESISFISDEKRFKRLKFFIGSHPLPSLENQAYTLEILQFIQGLPVGASLVCLISGGTSSLLCLPPDLISVHELQLTYQILLKSGASIDEMNTVRKHLSLVKGGGLAQKAHFLKLHSYLLSDVPYDKPEIIGSGPTLTDPTTFIDALQVLDTYQLFQHLPTSILEYLHQGAKGQYPETPKPGTHDHPDHQVHVITGEKSMKPFLCALLEQQGFRVHWAKEPIQGSVKKETKRIAAEIISVLNGQSTISKKKTAGTYLSWRIVWDVIGEGKGGRNQELALLLALSLEGQHPVTILTLQPMG